MTNESDFMSQLDQLEPAQSPRPGTVGYEIAQLQDGRASFEPDSAVKGQLFLLAIRQGVLSAEFLRACKSPFVEGWAALKKSAPPGWFEGTGASAVRALPSVDLAEASRHGHEALQAAQLAVVEGRAVPAVPEQSVMLPPSRGPITELAELGEALEKARPLADTLPRVDPQDPSVVHSLPVEAHSATSAAPTVGAPSQGPNAGIVTAEVGAVAGPAKRGPGRPKGSGKKPTEDKTESDLVYVEALGRRHITQLS